MSRLLKSVGMREEGVVRLTEGGEDNRLFVWGHDE
jgi:hypothetical protein